MAWSAIQLPTGGHVRLAMLGAVAAIVAVLAARDSEPADPGDSRHASVVGPMRAHDEHANDSATAASNNEHDLPRSCDALARDTAQGGPAAAAFGWLCPDAAMGPLAARAFVASIDTPTDAARAAVRLDGHPQLVALARFVAQQRIDLPSATPADTAAALPRPEKASVSPIDDDILRHTQRARAVIYAKGITHEQRTRARAYLAKVSVQGLQQLGLNPGLPASAMSRTLAAVAMHHARGTAEAHWRRRVPGLAPVFSQLEDTLLTTLLALQASPHAGDSARASEERGRVRDYVLRSGPSTRIDARAAKRSEPTTPVAEAVWSLPEELPRLAAHGTVDRAVQHIVAAARDPDGPGLTTLRRLLADSLAQCDRPELVARMDQRLARVRESLPETGPGTLPDARPSGGGSADDVAEEAGDWLAQASRTHDEFPRRYAITRGYLALRTRPDAVAVLLERLVSAPDTDLAAARQILLALLLDSDGRRQSSLRLHVGVDAAFPDTQGVREAEAQRRRRFAAALRL